MIFLITGTDGLDTCKVGQLQNSMKKHGGDSRLLEKRLETRRNFQQQAFTYMKMLAYLSQLAMEQQCILPKQYE